LAADHNVHGNSSSALTGSWSKRISAAGRGTDYGRTPGASNIIARCCWQRRRCTVLAQRPYLCKGRCDLISDHNIHRSSGGTLTGSRREGISAAGRCTDHGRTPGACNIIVGRTR